MTCCVLGTVLDVINYVLSEAKDLVLPFTFHKGENGSILGFSNSLVFKLLIIRELEFERRSGPDPFNRGHHLPFFCTSIVPKLWSKVGTGADLLQGDCQSACRASLDLRLNASPVGWLLCKCIFVIKTP